MPKPKSIANGQATTNGHAAPQEADASGEEMPPAEAAATTDALAEALALKQSLQEAMGKTHALIAALRRQTRQW
jgi:hypothetical protein